MSKKKGKGLVPKLRFPGFVGEWDWTETNLGSLGELVSGLTYSPKDLRGNGLLVLRSSNIQNGNIYLEDNVYVRDDIKGANLSQPKDILICVRNGSKTLIGKNALIPSGLPRCTHGAFMTVLRSLDSDFVFQLLQTDNYQKQVSADLGATINSINGGQLKKYRFWVPDGAEERKKIADCLSSLDDLITAHTKKHEALKTYKKALMQKLFPAEGASVPELRFPGFEGEWEEAEIGTLFKFKQGLQVPIDCQYASNKEGMVRFIRIIDITSNAEKPRYINNPGQSHIITNDDLFMIRYGTPGLISIGFSGVIANNLFRLVWKSSENYFSRFWFYIFQKIEKMILNLSGSSSMPAINFSTLDRFLITYSKNNHEQKKITECLSSLDDLIAAEDKRIEDLQTHKKGLMQQLFPIVDKVSE